MGVSLGRQAPDWRDDPDADWQFTAACFGLRDESDDPAFWIRRGELAHTLTGEEAREEVQRLLEAEFGDLPFIWSHDRPGHWTALIQVGGGEGGSGVREPRRPRPSSPTMWSHQVER